ncbi:MAG: CBS domain-containing protein [Gammaproteobacteria bacterium]|nr:MAG: CBS domain-containing protein [Gammaproteobacteria bacterium]
MILQIVSGRIGSWNRRRPMSVFFVQPSQRTLTPLRVRPESRTAEPVSELTQIRPVVAHAPDQLPVQDRAPGGWLSRWQKPRSTPALADEAFEDESPRVRDFMSPQVILGDNLWSVRQARAFMEAHQIHHLPCINAARELQHVVTLEQVLTGWLDAGPETRLEDLGTGQPLLVTTPEARVADLVTSMLIYRIRGLPVVTLDGHLAGMITQADLCRLALRDVVDGWA